MEKIKFIIIGIVLGIVLTLGAGYFIVIRPSQSTIANYKAEQQRLKDTNSALTESVRQRDENIGRLESLNRSLKSENTRARTDYTKLEAANRERQNIISTAGKLIDGSDDAIEKLNTIIDAFEKLEQSINH